MNNLTTKFGKSLYFLSNPIHSYHKVRKNFVRTNWKLNIETLKKRRGDSLDAGVLTDKKPGLESSLYAVDKPAGPRESPEAFLVSTKVPLTLSSHQRCTSFRKWLNWWTCSQIKVWFSPKKKKRQLKLSRLLAKTKRERRKSVYLFNKKRWPGEYWWQNPGIRSGIKNNWPKVLH